MNQYEVLYIIRTDIDEAAIAAVMERFSTIITENGATIDKVEPWGKKRLAYPIDYKNEGYYVLLNMTAAPEFPAELERNFRNAEEILRYLVIRKDA